MITPDLIPDEADEWLAASDAHGLDRIFLVAPSSPEERIALDRRRDPRVPVRGVDHGRDGRARPGVRRGARPGGAVPRASPTLPIGVGLGVRTGRQAAEVAGFADAVIVGSAFVRAAESRWRGGRPASWPPNSPRARAPEELQQGDTPATQPQRCHPAADGGRPPARARSRRERDVLAYIPQPAAGGVVPRADPDPRLRAVHHRGHRRRRVVGREAVRRPRRPARPGHRRRGVRRAVRPRRRPALPRQPPTSRPTSARGRPPARPHDLGGRPRHLGRGRARRGRRLDRLPPLRRAAAVLRRRGGARHRRGAGDRPAGQLLQPGAVRQPRPRCRGAWRSTAGSTRAPGSPTRSTASR